MFALNTDASIYKMVENAYKVTLVAAFVPLAFGLYWQRATSQGATLAIVFGLATWINLEIVSPDGLVPPQLAGLAMSLAGMLVGSLVSFAGGQKSRASTGSRGADCTAPICRGHAPDPPGDRGNTAVFPGPEELAKRSNCANSPAPSGRCSTGMRIEIKVR